MTWMIRHVTGGLNLLNYPPAGVDRYPASSTPGFQLKEQLIALSLCRPADLQTVSWFRVTATRAFSPQATKLCSAAVSDSITPFSPSPAPQTP
jgi:hypothetical protein